MGKAAGICGIRPEFIRYGGPPLVVALHLLFQSIWISEDIPSEWRKSIIMPIYNGKGTRNYRGITLLSVPGKVFAHVLLARIKPLLLKHRRQQQSGFTPGRSTADHILTLVSQTSHAYGKSTYTAYVDLKSAFDSLSRPALWLLLQSIGVPQKIINLMAALYTDSSSCVRVNGKLSDFFTFFTGVR